MSHRSVYHSTCTRTISVLENSNLMATKTIKTHDSERMNFWEKLYLPEIAKGLALTMKQMFQPKFTREYPEERFEPAAGYRGRPVLVLEDYGERCVACGLCS